MRRCYSQRPEDPSERGRVMTGSSPNVLTAISLPQQQTEALIEGGSNTPAACKAAIAEAVPQELAREGLEHEHVVAGQATAATGW
jgi:hypothetical protein